MAEHYIQSITINKNVMTKKQAINWVIKHFGNIKKIDETDTQYRFRQKSPIILKKNGFIRYYTRSLPNGVNLIIAHK